MLASFWKAPTVNMTVLQDGQDLSQVDCVATICTSAGAGCPDDREPRRRAAIENLQTSMHRSLPRQAGLARTTLVSSRLNNLQDRDCSTSRAGCRWYLAEAPTRSQPSLLFTDQTPTALDQGQSHQHQSSQTLRDCLTSPCAQSCRPKATERCCS